MTLDSKKNSTSSNANAHVAAAAAAQVSVDPATEAAAAAAAARKKKQRAEQPKEVVVWNEYIYLLVQVGLGAWPLRVSLRSRRCWTRVAGAQGDVCGLCVW